MSLERVPASCSGEHHGKMKLLEKEDMNIATPLDMAIFREVERKRAEPSAKNKAN